MNCPWAKMVLGGILYAVGSFVSPSVQPLMLVVMPELFFNVMDSLEVGEETTEDIYICSGSLKTGEGSLVFVLQAMFITNNNETIIYRIKIN